MYIFQEDIKSKNIRHTGCEKFDSLYQLYRIFPNPNYFLYNIFIPAKAHINSDELLALFKKDNIKSCVIRCEKTLESCPIAAKAFQNIAQQRENFIHYLQTQLATGYNCIIHEVIQGPYLSNRLDWVFSFGIWYKDNLPHIEIYPATDASSIKWGKLSPLYFIDINQQLQNSHHTMNDPQTIQQYQNIKLSEWITQFKTELPNEPLYHSISTLKPFLQKNNHYLFHLENVEKSIQKHKTELVNLAMKYSYFAQQNAIDTKNKIIHGSLLFNQRIIIWDISSDKRWEYLKQV